LTPDRREEELMSMIASAMESEGGQVHEERLSRIATWYHVDDLEAQ